MLPMTAEQISALLLSDWFPSVPAPVSSSFMGWPQFLIETTLFKNDDVDYNVLALRREVGTTERQWKGVVSWMLGIACTRRVLESEGYRWIAPLSAFYPDVVQPVDIPEWPANFDPGVVTAESDPNNHSRLRPDYLALRSTATAEEAGQYEWAVAESKGTNRCLTDRSECPEDWYNQARNVVFKIGGTTVDIPRHLVIATRVHPKGVRPATWRIQLRAWNSKAKLLRGDLAPEAATTIAAAHLFGLFRNLRLYANARALSEAARIRNEARFRLTELNDVKNERHTQDIFDQADKELAKQGTQAGKGSIVTVEMGFNKVEVVIDQALTEFANAIRRPENWEDGSALKSADLELDTWEHLRKARGDDDRTVSLPIGIDVRDVTKGAV